ncbi:MAG: hypothetical protein LBL90_10195 [Prevotellaceae bacterium]|jgi:hypothetical protein|nr:hypothetical protein [Prevotellaceae bacterium]
MIEFKKTKLKALKDLREDYFEEIKLSQELFLKWTVTEGLCFKIIEERKEIGYFILLKDTVLLEFYLIYKVLVNKKQISKRLVTEYAISSAFCKTFNYVLMTYYHTLSKSSDNFQGLFKRFAG